jgi:hypothetical protein
MKRIIKRRTDAEKAADTESLRRITRGDKKWLKIAHEVEAVEAEWRLPALSSADPDPVLIRAGVQYDGQLEDSALSRHRWARELRCCIVEQRGSNLLPSDANQTDPKFWMGMANRKRMLGV